MSKVRDAIGAIVVVAIFCAPLTLVVALFNSCENAPAPAQAKVEAPEAAVAGAGYPFTTDVTVSTTPVLIGAPQASGKTPMSVSVYNPTANACYWGDAAIDAGVGTSYCTTGCDRDVPMGGDFREIYVDCASSSGLDVHMMLTSRSE